MSFVFPSPRIIAPDSAPRLRWGIVGAGTIADSFARALRFHTEQSLVGVASRRAESAAAMAARHGIPRAYESVEQLLSDDGIEVVYVATPHTEHKSVALAAIAAGKHVLVEKPFAESAESAKAIADAARAAGVFAMEAMWTRYNPHIDVLRQLVDDGEIGEVQTVIADFGFPAPFDPSSRMWNPDVGGGALLDAGIYPISFAASLLGMPDRVVVSGTVASTGVDASAALIFEYQSGATAQLTTSITGLLPTHASVVGTSGRIDLPAPFFNPREVVLSRYRFPGFEALTWTGALLPQASDALSFEATALASYVGEGRTESPLHTLDETVALVGLVEDARNRILSAGRAAGV